MTPRSEPTKQVIAMAGAIQRQYSRDSEIGNHIGELRRVDSPHRIIGGEFHK
jgi:hypothetical protein